MCAMMQQVQVKPYRIKTPNKDILAADSWTQRIQIEALQRSLGSGFVSHLQAGPLPSLTMRMRSTFQAQPVKGPIHIFELSYVFAG
jgi:hypothetical protein